VWEISWVLNECYPVANGIDLSLLERVIPTGDGLLMLGDDTIATLDNLLQCGSKS
jgi:hypothetical protein